MQTTCSSDAITAAIFAASMKTKRGWIAQTNFARQPPKQAPSNKSNGAFSTRPCCLFLPAFPFPLSIVHTHCFLRSDSWSPIKRLVRLGSAASCFPLRK
jgi:hypothetical protein